MSNITHCVLFFPECSLDDLLTCSSRTNIDDETLCCAVNGQTSICVTVTGVSIGSVATYSTSNNYCIDTLTNRTCTNDRMWSGTAPNATEGLFCSSLLNYYHCSISISSSQLV